MTVVRHRVRVLVGGRVQGVGFRYAAAREARRLGLDGWVRNTADGCVEIVAEGAAAEIESLCDWCRQGPPAAHVDSVSRREETAEEEGRGFVIRA